MARTQHVILSCTNRKRGTAGDPLRLREIPVGDVATRAARWIDAISDQPASQTVATLYAGEYWQAGTALGRAASSLGPVEVSVLSAGLGFVNSKDYVPSYSATFATGHEDSVCGRPDVTAMRRRWWSELIEWPGPSRCGSVRSLTEAAASPDAHLLVCAGPDYLDAVADDLRLAHKVLGDRRLVIVASGAPLEGLSEVWVRCPGRLRLRVGGSMASTGVRVARLLFETVQSAGEVNAHVARDFVAGLLDETPPLPRYERARMSDDQVRAWIADDLAANPAVANKSASIRRLRQQGLACEQGRFGRMYEIVEASGE